MATLAELAAQGAAKLDQSEPGWWQRVPPFAGPLDLLDVTPGLGEHMEGTVLPTAALVELAEAWSEEWSKRGGGAT